MIRYTTGQCLVDFEDYFPGPGQAGDDDTDTVRDANEPQGLHVRGALQL